MYCQNMQILKRCIFFPSQCGSDDAAEITMVFILLLEVERTTGVELACTYVDRRKLVVFLCSRVIIVT